MKNQEEIDRYGRSFTIIKKISESIEEIGKKITFVGSYLKKSRNHFNGLEKAEN